VRPEERARQILADLPQDVKSLLHRGIGLAIQASHPNVETVLEYCIPLIAHVYTKARADAWAGLDESIRNENTELRAVLDAIQEMAESRRLQEKQNG